MVTGAAGISGGDMTLISRRNMTPLAILMMVVYTSVFLLHDLAHHSLPLSSDAPGGPHGLFSSQGGDGSAGDHDRLHPTRESHHCPFCNGFVGGVTVALLPPPAGDNGKLPLPPSFSDHGETRFTSIARAPPAA
jgi:hypothetical protein